MRLLVASTVAAFGALTAADGLQLKRSFLSLSSNEAFALLDPPTLQEQLDRRCRNEATELCKTGNDLYCKLSDVFARYDTGTAEQTKKQWRCFLAEELSFETYGQSCVDNCGNLVMCLGVNLTPSKEHLTRFKAIEEVIQTQKPTYCRAPAPSLQESLNRKCYERANAACAAGQSEYCNSVMYARHDVTAGSDDRQWRCYALRSLSFTHYGSACADACGNLTICQGTAVGEINPPPLDYQDAISETIDNNVEAYCDSPALTLQGVLDRTCDKLGKDLCLKGSNPEFCGIGLVARKDFGHSGQRKLEWRCYAETALTYDQYSPRCVDNCGNMVNCLGHVSGATTHHITRNQQLTALIEANRDSYCSKTNHLYTPLQEPMPEEPTHAGEPSAEGESPGSHAGAATPPTPEAQPTVPEQPSESVPGAAPEVESPGSNAGAATAPTPEAQPTVPEQPSESGPEDEEAPALLVGPGPPRVPGTGILQDLLDAMCIEKFAKICLTDASFCEYAVARKDANAWHCVAFKGLDYRHSTHACVDKCGNIISCPGKGNNATKHLTANDLEEAKNQYERMTCKVPEHQRATATG